MSQCHVDETALNRCQSGFDELKTLLQQIHDDNIEYREKARKRNDEIGRWEDNHRIQLNRLRDGKTAPYGQVWYNNRLYSCSTYAPCWWGAAGAPQPKNSAPR